MRCEYLRAATLLFIGTIWGCVSDQGSGLSGLQLKDPRGADPFEVVNCLLPGQIRQLGTQVTYVTARQPVRTTAEDCAIRGGEYVALDRADYGTALKVWMNAAQDGDPDAQYYVGVLYEKGAEGQPNYAKAADWYRKAADRGVRRAAINLGRLYEQGLGVTKSDAEARQWYAKANGAGELPKGELVSQADTVQQELTDARARLTERMSLLEDERRKLDQLKPHMSSIAQGIASAQAITKQEHITQVRQEEVAKLQAKVAALKTTAQQQIAAAQQAPAQDQGLRGPSIQIGRASCRERVLRLV